MKKFFGRIAFSMVAALVLLGASDLNLPTAHAGPGDDQGTGSILGNLSLKTTLELLQCDDGANKTWKTSKLTYRIVNNTGADTTTLNAVRAGVQAWAKSGAPYKFTEVTTGQADITINLVAALDSPRTIGETESTCRTGREGITSAAISLKLAGLSPIGVKNLTAHETGHALGLGHTDRLADLMGPTFDTVVSNLVPNCPSNLDIGALSAKTDTYAVNALLWLMVPVC